MKASNSPSYDRAPSEELRMALACGFLTPVVSCSERSVSDCGLDVHLRVNDEVHVYCGHANLMQVRLNRDGTITVKADDAFAKQACADKLFGQWRGKETNFEEILCRYLDGVIVDDRQTAKEGLLQAQWSRIQKHPWTPFDRECVLAGMGQRTDPPEVECALGVLRAVAARSNRGGKSWVLPERPTGRELDQIAVDEDGNLVLIELKDANTGSLASIFYSPLQLLAYIYEWYIALGSEPIWKQLQRLIDIRKDLGLMADAPRLKRGIRAAICFGDDARSDEVKRRFYEALGIANSHLPSGVKPIETWMLDRKLKPTPL